MIENQTKRYSTLDGMRGIAALFVVSRHFGELRDSGIGDQLSYLAVDFFFVLSGFVLSTSYGERIASESLSRRRFLLDRVIRLWPLYLLGLAIPSIVAVADGFIHHNGAFGFFKVLIKAIILFPSNFGKSYAPLFVLNLPTWSLFFELYVANTIFCIIAKHKNNMLLFYIVVFSAALLIISDLYFSSIDIGVDGGTVLGGFPRVTYSFFVGVWIDRARIQHRRVGRVPPWLPVIMLSAILLLYRGNLTMRIFELFAVLILLPVTVVLGSQAMVSKPRLWNWLGNTSYAVYVLHFGFIMIAARFLTAHRIYPGYVIEAIFFVALLTCGWLANSGDIIFRRRLTATVNRISTRFRQKGSIPHNQSRVDEGIVKQCRSADADRADA